MIKPLDLNRTTALIALGALVALAPLSRAAEQDTKSDSKVEQPAPAQQNRRAAAAQQFDAMAEKLKLNDDQKKQLQPIVREEMGKLRELRQDTSLTNEDRRQKAKGIREQYLAKAKPILSAEQFDQYKKMREQNAGRGGPRGVRSGGAAQPPADASGSSDTKK